MNAQIVELTQRDRDYYQKNLTDLQEAMDAVIQKLSRINEEYQLRFGESLGEHFKARIKSADSVEEKLVRKGFAPGADSAMENLTDLVGLRIVCSFVDDVFLIARRLKEEAAFTVLSDKDYIQFPKPNGYRSYHLILSVTVASGREVPVEIQLRTIAMDCWASLEHQISYKKEIPNRPMLARELKRCADEIASTDLSMQAIRDMIQKEV